MRQTVGCLWAELPFPETATLFPYNSVKTATHSFHARVFIVILLTFQTYNVDHQVADSAATATAYLCGIKANYGTIGVNAFVKRGKCHAVKGNNVTCIAELAQNAGKSAAVILLKSRRQ